MEPTKTSKKRLWQRFILPSTVAMIQEARKTPDYSWLDWLHGYVYGRWPYLYIGLGTGRHPLARRWGPLVARLSRLFTFKDVGQGNGLEDEIDREKSGGMAETYHGKVVPLDAAKQLVMVNEPITLRNLETIVPYERARDIVLKNPDHIIALECPCRAAKSNPCYPLDVCLVVGEPFASFVAEHHAGRSRWISSDEAVDILQAEDARGHVHHAFFKDAMLNRFYAICNCCACCCGAMQSQRNGTPMLAASGYRAQVDEDLCIGCGECQDACQFEALSLGEFFAQVDETACMGCGVCVSKCDQDALELVRAPEKGEPLEIFALMDQAANQLYLQA